jgi:hypothetical protein
MMPVSSWNLSQFGMHHIMSVPPPSEEQEKQVHEDLVGRRFFKIQFIITKRQYEKL